MVVNEQASKIAAPADRIWALFATEGGQRLLSRGFVRDMDFEGEGLGLIRTMHTEGHWGSTYVVERCDHFDPINREVTYAIIDTGGIVPFADYRGSAKVIPAGPDACVLMLRSTFIPVDMGEDEAKVLSEANFGLLFGNVKQAVAAGEV
ncbi:MAG TPA: SRPBCC family protein [Sphingomicrobium sp.]|nr:SRPBCC family protein [Sphingomicrobium sp.]